MPLLPPVTSAIFPSSLPIYFLLSCHFVRCSLRVHFRAIPMSGLRLSTRLASTLLVLDPLCEKCSQTEPPRSILVVVVGPTGNPFVLNMNDRYSSQGNWNSKALGLIIGRSLRCRKLPFSNDVISALESRIYFHHGIREELPGFLKEFDQAPLICKLESSA